MIRGQKGVTDIIYSTSFHRPLYRHIPRLPGMTSNTSIKRSLSNGSFSNLTESRMYAAIVEFRRGGSRSIEAIVGIESEELLYQRAYTRRAEKVTVGGELLDDDNAEGLEPR